MVHPHRQRGEEGAAGPLQPQEAEEIQLVTKNTHRLLQMHNREHPVGLYHRLVRQLPWVVRSAQRITGCKLPALKGHLHHPMSQEGQKDHQGQQPARATACSPRYHPECEVSTGASKWGPREAVFQSISRPSDC